MARQRLRSLKGTVKTTKLKRFDRLQSVSINLSQQQLSDLIETDQFVDIEVGTQERETLESSGWIVISSSNVKAIKYEENTLYVQFGNGTVYTWMYKAEEFYEGLKSAASAGRYIYENMYNTHSGHN